MKKQLFLSFVLASLIFSCSIKNEQTETATPVAAMTHMEDSLVTLWNDAWNRNDTNAIAAMFNDKSVVISGFDYVLTGADSIMQKWVNGQVKAVANLQTQKLQGNTSGNMAFYAGTWTLDVTNDKDSVVGNHKGSFTAAWEKQESSNWIISSIQMGE